MKIGIHNPFAKRVVKEEKISKYAIGEVDTDAPTRVGPKIHLDGGRYVIIIKDTDSAQIAVERLLSLMYTVAKTHERSLNMNGVYVGPRLVNTDERALTNKGRQLTVYAPEDAISEEAIYRRIAYTLLGLPLRTTYAKMGVEIYERNIG
jgi:hypothetical protein